MIRQQPNPKVVKGVHDVENVGGCQKGKIMRDFIDFPENFSMVRAICDHPSRFPGALDHEHVLQNFLIN